MLDGFVENGRFQVVIDTDGCSFELEIGRVVRLFFENCEVLLRAVGTVSDESASIVPDLRIGLSVEEIDGQMVAAGSAQPVRSATPGPSARHARPVAMDAAEPTKRKLSKHVVLHVLCRLLEQVTGIVQPWGYLTGIRPLKIVHNRLQQGASDEHIAGELVDDYLLVADRSRLLIDIAHRQRRVVPDLYDSHHAVSVYIGIPFCPTHCAYCTFPAYSMVDKATYVDDFLQAMDGELAQLGELLRAFRIPVTSVYVGGGTPTSLRASELDRLLAALHRTLPDRAAWREFTVEAGRPDTITPDRLRVMKQYGVDRISVNPQTYKASTLRHIRRGHTPDQVDHRFHAARDAGFDNINMDMIVGLPGETLDDVRYTMERIGRLDPESVTVHTMSLKRSSAVKNDREAFPVADDPTVRTMMDEAKNWVCALGHEPYYLYRQMDILGNQENIGFAKPGKESVYNICMMEERQTIIGVGGGAVTKVIGKEGRNYGRLANPREPKAYIDTIARVALKKDALLRRLFAPMVEG